MVEKGSKLFLPELMQARFVDSGQVPLPFREGRSEWNRNGKPAGLFGMFLACVLK